MAFDLYRRAPKIRLTPPAGPQLVYDLSAYQWVVLSDTEPIPVLEEKELITRDRVSTRYGFQLDASLVLKVAPGSNEDTNLAKIHDYIYRDDFVIELSLAQAGQPDNYRLGYFDKWQKTMIDGKKIGAVYSLHWKCQQLLKQLPAGDPVGPGVIVNW